MKNKILLEINDLGRKFQTTDGKTIQALQGVNLSLRTGAFMTVLGPTGCGKTTLLRLIAGLDAPTDGCITWSNPAQNSRPLVAMVFQDYSNSLFPWFTIEQQLDFACTGLMKSSTEIASRIDEALTLTSLSEYRTLLPKELSGGMQQRAVLARCLVLHPRVLLLDEPFGSLDALTRYQLEDDLFRIWRHTGMTIVLVTHDLDEAIYLSEEIIVLSKSPGTIKDTLQLDLPSTRSQEATRSLPRFGEIRARLWTHFQ